MSHIHREIDFIADVFIVFNNNVLLRKHDKYKTWMSPGGHIELNEDPNEAAIREAKEEVGLDIVLDDSLLDRSVEILDGRQLIPPYFLNRHYIIGNNNHEHISMVYFARATTDVILETSDREKSEEIKWFSKEDLLQNNEILPGVKFYALKAIEKLAQ
ncbi:MAG: NUDIX domain-containing protein [Candidatus Levybacteria bacterium]|nr:NUDIX domain-containing protein [Candidatus Levybacteria bacterium]